MRTQWATANAKIMIEIAIASNMMIHFTQFQCQPNVCFIAPTKPWIAASKDNRMNPAPILCTDELNHRKCSAALPSQEVSSPCGVASKTRPNVSVAERPKEPVAFPSDAELDANQDTKFMKFPLWLGAVRLVIVQFPAAVVAVVAVDNRSPSPNVARVTKAVEPGQTL
jgi:hypothetical protein